MEDKEKKLQEVAYIRYQYDWMAKHGHTIAELAESFGEYLREGFQYGDIDANDPDIGDAFQNWQNDVGFGGEIWACFDEFVWAEYLDAGYMERILTPDEFEQWKKTAGKDN